MRITHPPEQDIREGLERIAELRQLIYGLEAELEGLEDDYGAYRIDDDNDVVDAEGNVIYE